MLGGIRGVVYSRTRERHQGIQAGIVRGAESYTNPSSVFPEFMSKFVDILWCDHGFPR